MAEPYQKADSFKSELLETNQYSIDQLLKATNDMTFE
jgi:hypothetical protein